MSRALIVVDVQNDFCSGGQLAVPDGEFVVPSINELMRSGRYYRIVFTQDWHPADHSSFAENNGMKPFDTIEMPYGDQTLWPPHCLMGSRGAQFHSALDSSLGHMLIRKGFNKAVDSYSGFIENDRQTSTGLRGYLHEHGISDVDVCGLALDKCVRFTAEDSADLGFKTRILAYASRALVPSEADPLSWERENLTVVSKFR